MPGSYLRDGLVRDKYTITKTSGEPVDPTARYFVLRYDADPHARVALAAYAESVRADNQQLADDLVAELHELELEAAHGNS